jgi:hypothetical protein
MDDINQYDEIDDNWWVVSALNEVVDMAKYDLQE